ncbi:hypothetical protein HPB51_017236 [Rhipicephalus microplus]|uniref:CCHC-type domain-containing protein n=1 Tax=Rhipicephalus microplus TaxID=6941 RepID=A0A9J6EBJ4_RHIMP|nr:hypothetical protein HPB51_017236 [Rhipicephalus microplus]
MASTSSQLNAVSHNRFAALATEDMDFCAGGNDTTTTDTINDQEVLRSTDRTAVAVRGNDLHPSDIAGWKISGKQVSQRLNKPQLNEVTQSNKPTPQFSEAQAKRMVVRITKASRMPLNLPREEQKIVIRPRGGLFLAKLEADIVMSAVITAANVPKTTAKADTICINPTQNIIVISTPDEERARYYASVRSLYIGGRSYETHAYCTAPHGTVKGVIRGIAVENTAEDLHENIVNQANPQALEAHRIGNTTSIVILFAGTKVPNYIKYGSIIVKCGLYRQHHNVCKTCGKIGHRADVCPTPETKICFACGAPNPTADHAARCKPRCKLCNGAHATGTEGCTNKYKVPFVVTQCRWERENAASAFSSQDFPQLPPQQQNEAHLSKRGRSRSRKRDKSRRQSASRGRSTDGKRSENMNYNRNQQRPGNVINGAQAINPQAANRNLLNHVAEAKDNTIQSLRNENEQLKRCIAEQRAQMQEMNAKLNQLINAQQQQQQQQVTPPPPLSPPQSQPRPPTPKENNTNSAMEVQVPVTTEANSAEPETIDGARTSEPAPKKRALEYARERRVNARLDSLEERQDRLEQTMKANYETLSQVIKATNDRLDATNARLDTLVTPVHGMQSTIQGIQTKLDALIHALTASGLIPQQAFTQPQ